MIYRLIFLLCSFSFLHSREREDLSLSSVEEIVSLTTGAELLIDGFISPLNGQLVLRQRDLIAVGAQEVSLNRSYIAPYIPSSLDSKPQRDNFYLFQHLKKTYRGWVIYPHVKMKLTQLLHPRVNFSDPGGATLQIIPATSPEGNSYLQHQYGICNFAGDLPSGKYDLRNTHVYLKEGGEQVIVQASDGTERHYRRGTLQKGTFAKWRILDKEILPNGKILKYIYDFTDHLLSVESRDPQERHTYASLTINGDNSFITSCGKRASYTYQHRKSHKDKIKIHKDILTPLYLSHLAQIDSPFFHHEQIDYNPRQLLETYLSQLLTFRSTYLSVGKKEEAHQRLHQLRRPAGYTLEEPFDVLYTFEYALPIPGKEGGRTYVNNSDGTSTIYHFSSEMLLTAIQTRAENGDIKTEKHFFWDQHQRLQGCDYNDGQKRLLYRKEYRSDRLGNPIQETLFGDLTGEGEQSSYTFLREFSLEGRHLLLKEQTESGKTTTFTYLPQTNLSTTELIRNAEQIIHRTFYEYDECNNLLKKIIDDGASEDKDDLLAVTQRTLTEYTLRQEQPFLHIPEWIEEKYLEGSEYKLLKKRHLLYDRWGNVCQEEIYDAAETLAYSLYREYNERGDLLSETNPLGQKASYSYDDRGHRITSTSFSGRLHTERFYDLKNRLRQENEITSEEQHQIVYAYDLNDHLLRKSDILDRVTHYNYDALSHQVVRTTSPPISSSDNQPTRVVTHSTYDAFGRESSKTDGNGNMTTFRYNAYNQPIEIIHPDKSRESFRYTTGGKLASHTDQEGMTTHFTYDVLERITLKTYLGADGKELAHERFVYNAFHLLEQTDKEGTSTHFTYDKAGRKIREETLDKVTDFFYDALGRVSKICKHNEENTLLIHYKRDLLGRLLEEFKSDKAGVLLYKIAYAYDEEGNRSSITRHLDEEEAEESFTYDPFNRLIEHKDALGQSTKISYDERSLHILGQRVLKKTTLDPKGVATLEVQDALGRLSKIETFNAAQKTLSSREFSYDLNGNLLYQQDHIYENEIYKKTVATAFTYTAKNEQESLTRAAGTRDERVTHYTHTPSGLIKCKELPNGLILNYSYTPFGFLERLSASDGTLQHHFLNNRLGHLLQATDLLQGVSIEREVDAFGNVLKETFPKGLQIEKLYDFFDRVTSLKLANQGSIHYTYDPLFLREVRRVSPSGETLYTHHYDHYDLSGNLLSETLIHRLGQVSHVWDLKGRKQALQSPYLSQMYAYDETDNLIYSQSDDAIREYAYDALSQLTLEKKNEEILRHGWDSNYNPAASEQRLAVVDDLDQLLTLGEIACSYDLNGNLISKQTPNEITYFTYDPLNQLIEATNQQHKVHFTYDPLGRRLSKAVYLAKDKTWKPTQREEYLYEGDNEVGAFSEKGTCKNLRVLGLTSHAGMPQTMAIELEGRSFAPILDQQGSVCQLIDPVSKDVIVKYALNAFGEKARKEGESVFNPWRYHSKRLDPELNLVYFGKRDYDPELMRWLTTDPAGFIDSVNLYQYVLNNPFRYVDPDGQFLQFAIPLLIWGAEIVLPAVSTFVAPVLYGAMAGMVVYGGYKGVQKLNEGSHHYTSNTVWDLPSKVSKSEVEIKEKKKGNQNLSKKKKEGTPKSREVQQKQADDAKKEIEQKLGRKLTPRDARKFHDNITGQDYNYKELVEEGYWLFHE